MIRQPAAAAQARVPASASVWLSSIRRRGATIATAAALALLAGAGAGHAASPPPGKHPATKAEATPPPAAKKKKKAPDPRSKQRPARPKALAGAHPISQDSAKIIAFPTDAAAVSKAFADNRRTQLADAERVARSSYQKDRWRTVLFELRDLDSPADPEACFWRVVAYYRLGELRQARQIRQGCQFGGREDASLDGEDATSAALQPASALPELRSASGEREESPRGPGGERLEPVVNENAYGGAAPARFR